MDAGGAADLQTDIMRFMAILALCLVAIFALVQSISLQPSEATARAAPLPRLKPMEPEAAAIEIPTPPVSGSAAAPTQVPAAPQPKPDDVREVTWRDLIPKSTPVDKTTPDQSTQAPVTPAPPPEPRARELAASPPVSPPAPASSSHQPEVRESDASTSDTRETVADDAASEGFTLRFESDPALTRLVARSEIGLYAITDDKALRMSVNRGSYSFWPASVPNQFHEMDAATVPADVITALRRSGSLGLSPGVKWGVTLPTQMQSQLNDYLASHTGGALVIGSDGGLRLEP
jgi:hypothetical protein